VPGFQTVLLKDICNFEKGSIGLAKAIPGEYPLVTTGADRRTCESFQFDTNAVCIPLVSSTGHGHASLKNVHYQEGKFALGTILVALTAKDKDVLNIQFLHLYLSQLKNLILVPLMSGAANVALSVGKIKTIEIPLPSIERQGEIVSQFKRIVAEEDELKTELTHQQTLLKKLRQQILQEAIEGKLTADWRVQNPDIEPASELLARIQAEKAQLIKEKKIKKQKPLPPISEEEKPFVLLDGWVWCRTGFLLNNFSTGPFGSMLHKSDYVTNGIPLVNPANMVDGVIVPSVKMMIDQKTRERLSRYVLKIGELVVARRGNLSKCAIVSKQEAGWLCGTGSFFIQTSNSISIDFFVRVYRSPFFQKQLADTSIGQTMANLNQKILSSALYPLPPLLEQKAIVTKVEKLLAICDQLEVQISQNQSHAEQLMQAVLKEAFSQNNGQIEQVAVNV